jgi:hypothetical protein
MIASAKLSSMPFDVLPAFAAWHHVGARDGFEVVFIQSGPDGFRFEGETVAIEAAEPWWVHYVIELSSSWFTRQARLSVRSLRAVRAIVLESDGDGHWLIDGRSQPYLDGCPDVDLESSAVTNTFPVHRLTLEVGQSADAPAAYVRAVDLSVERLDQRYERLPDDASGHRYAYKAPRFDADFVLPYDASGLVTDYPGLARRSH